MSRWTDQDLAYYQSRQSRCGIVGTIQSNPVPIGPVMEVRRLIVVSGTPVSKPRQTRSDKWNLRECVKRYRAWADEARKCAGKLPSNPQRMDVVAYFPLTKKAKAGLPHMVRPDSDNILKSCADALFPDNDSMIHEMRIKKRYDDGRGPRVEIIIY